MKAKDKIVKIVGKEDKDYILSILSTFYSEKHAVYIQKPIDRPWSTEEFRYLTERCWK